LWRIVWGCFPIDKLERRGVQCTDGCPFCENHYENEWHLFVGCGKAKEVWITTGLWDGLSHFMANAVDFASLFFDIIQKWQQHNVLDFVMMLCCYSVLKPGSEIDPVKALGHWLDLMNEILIKKNPVIFFVLFKVRTLKNLYSHLQACKLIS